MSFPLYHDAGIGEPATVEVMRISPRDAINLVDEARENRCKLAGTALANFGAFIDRNWRLNDVMWGRLDGAERLIQAVLPMRDAASETVRKELISLAQRKILQEELLPDGSARLTELLLNALAEMPTEGDAKQRVQQLLDEILPSKPDDQQRQQLVTVLASHTNEHALVNYIQQKRKVEREAGSRKDMEHISRAVTILGRMLEKISQQKNKHTLVFRWIAHVSLLFQRLVALSMPGSLAALWRAHLMTIVTVMVGITLIAAWIFGAGALFGMAAKTLAVIALLYLAFFVLGGITQSKGRIPRKSLWMLGIVVAALTAFGGVSLFDRLASMASEMGGNATNVFASRPNGTER